MASAIDRSITLGAVAVLTAVLATSGQARPGESAASPVASGAQILGDDSYLRAFLAFRTPVVVSKDGQIKTALEPVGKDPKPMAEFQSPLPPADWTKPEFDDSSWDRHRAPVEMGTGAATGGSPAARHTATVNSLICLRSKFVVEDPAKCGDLRLSLDYVGGVAVYVNGQELTRGSLPSGELKPETLAEKYPDELYCEEGGLYLQDVRKNPAGFERRFRKLSDVVVPAKLLRKGANVLALEIHRAPINETALEAKRVAAPGGMSSVPGMWAYAGLRHLSLSAPAGAGVTPNLTRPKGVQVWNCAPFDTINAFDYGDGGELLPVAVSSPRNGVFSGRLVVSSDDAIKGLKVTVSDLAAAGGGKIPAAAVRVRVAVPGPNIPYSQWAPPFRYDALLDAIPAEIPVVKSAPPREFYLRGPYDGQPIERKGQASGALAPLWLTARVPKDAKPGSYEGTVTVEAAGLKATTVPLKLSVSDWTAPDAKDLRMLNFAYHSEDAIAKRYEVPRWSDKHFELLGRSMALMAEVNSRQAIANLAINFYGGNKGGADNSNEESLVRWIKQPDGSYKHDFALFDKFLDTVAKHIGKPTLLRINCWGEVAKKDGKLVHNGVTSVSRLDPATGKVEPMEQPVPGTEESLAFWKPVLDEVRKKVEARGWWDVTALGHNSYCYNPAPEVISVAKKIWPDGVWSYTAHNGTMGSAWKGTEANVSMPIRQADCVWTLGRLTPRGYSALLKPRPTIWCFTWRSAMRDASELTLLRNVPEDEIMRGHDGVSDFGADLFPVKDANGRWACLGNGRGTGGPSCSTLAMLAPGPDGPVATERFEMLREGVELAEAILLVQRAIEEKKLGGELEAKANRLLDERAEAFLKNWTAGRFTRDTGLLALAGEVAKTVQGGGETKTASK
jgi:hypothetical protein